MLPIKSAGRPGKPGRPECSPPFRPMSAAAAAAPAWLYIFQSASLVISRAERGSWGTPLWPGEEAGIKNKNFSQKFQKR